ncbi:MAG TPA: ABC transporter permease [Candidatus Sulfotelmatobacter sp.]|nr:ABC transporter permease [Candidatus Sulfotelmatobacter sp.]
MFSRAYKIIVTVPPVLWVAVFLLLPYLLMFCYSFWSVSPAQTIVHSWNIGNYKELLLKSVYWETLLRSMFIAARVTLFSLLLGYPLAYFLSFHAGPRKDLLYQLVIIPLWVSYLVRAYAWKTILGSDGVLNTLLQYAHLTNHPLDFLLYSPFAVVLTLTHIYTPFAFLPIYAALEHIPRNLVEASHDLGANPARTFWRVIFPLSIPGVVAGATFAFVLSLGDFLAPLLLGGPSGIMISNIVVSLFGAAYNWPLGAAISLGMLLIVVSLLFLSERLEKKWSFS